MRKAVKSLCSSIPESIAKFLRNIFLAQDLASYCIVHIMMDIRNLIGKPDDLTLKGGRVPFCLVIQYPVSYLLCKVQTGAALFKYFNNPDRLYIMLEAFRTYSSKSPLPRVSKGRMTYIVTKRNCFRQILVHPECLGDGSGILRYFKGVGKSCSVVVTLRRKENLGLILQSPE